MKEIYKLYMLGIVIAATLVFLWIFGTAYSSPEKKVMVDINSIGESNLEMWIFFPITLFCCIYLFVDKIKEVRHDILPYSKG